MATSKRRKARRNVTVGIAHIKATFNNTTVTMVLLCVALMCTMPRTTLRRCFLTFFAMNLSLLADPQSEGPSQAAGWILAFAGLLTL